MNPSFIIRTGTSLVVLAATSLAGLGQSPQERLSDAYNLEKQGKPSEAIEELRALLDAHALNEYETGKAWNMLGLGYEDRGELQLSQRAYEEAIRILKPLPAIRDYAMALDDLGHIYIASGDFQAADTLRKKALALYEKAGDHGGIARAATDLAGSAFRQNRVSQANEYLARALKEARIADDLDGDDRAAIAAMEGWKAQHDRDFGTSVAKYRAALDLWRQTRGEEHPSTGWAHLLLGEALAAAGEPAAGLNELKVALDILNRSLGREHPRTLLAELSYARILDASGSHTEAMRIRATAEPKLKETVRRQCLGCSVSVMALH